MTRVKICGNRSVAEALIAAQSGADAVGILVGPHSESQKHFVTTETACDILAALPPFIRGVIVTTYSTEADITSLIEMTGATVVQCHSDIQPRTLATLRERFPAVHFIAVVHVAGSDTIEIAHTFASVAHALLLDTAYKGAAGGTGVTHDWSVSADIVRAVSVPVILAGGLNPENVRDAIAQVRPYAVDVRSGVCTITGEKNEEKMKAFINHAHTV
jgi:phosphoribosylanthranilate isomerase